MNKPQLIGALCAAVFSFITLPSQAALIPVLSGQAYYDDMANLTWLADANAGAGSSFDNGSSTTDGRMTWTNANAWAAGLDVDGVTGWRLPTTDPAVSGFNQSGSEMGNMFYNVLGGVENTSISTTHNSNYDLFSNVQSNFYWSSTEYAPNLNNAWGFVFNRGEQTRTLKTKGPYAWAVQSGNVGGAISSVPVPAAVWLFGSGLIGLVGISRRKKAT